MISSSVFIAMAIGSANCGDASEVTVPLAFGRNATRLQAPVARPVPGTYSVKVSWSASPFKGAGVPVTQVGAYDVYQIATGTTSSAVSGSTVPIARNIRALSWTSGALLSADLAKYQFRVVGRYVVASEYAADVPSRNITTDGGASPLSNVTAIYLANILLLQQHEAPVDTVNATVVVFDDSATNPTRAEYAEVQLFHIVSNRTRWMLNGTEHDPARGPNENGDYVLWSNCTSNDAGTNHSWIRHGSDSKKISCRLAAPYIGAIVYTVRARSCTSPSASTESAVCGPWKTNVTTLTPTPSPPSMPIVSKVANAFSLIVTWNESAFRGSAAPVRRKGTFELQQDRTPPIR